MSAPEQTQCCIVGGGPAGVVLGLLLARRGVDVTLLEMHPDFDRDFRGDTVHASTLEILDQIGLAEPLHQLPHAKMRGLSFNVGGRTIPVVNFGRLKTRFPYVMVMPQSVFLEFLVARAGEYPNFRLVMAATVGELVKEEGRVVGVRYSRSETAPGEPAPQLTELRADVVVACDGRFSRLRKLTGVEAQAQSTVMDVAWFRLPRRADDGLDTGGFFIGGGRLVIMLVRPEEWQVGYVFPKGDYAAVREEGLDAFRQSIVSRVPWLADRVDAITGWRDVHLLSVKADRLSRWHVPGLLFIGDAAHVMSPVGGIGINYAIADAVEAANVLGPVLGKGGDVRAEVDGALMDVQRRRERPTRIVQRIQSVLQHNIVARALRAGEFRLPWLARAVLAVPGLRDVPPRAIALGIGTPKIDP